MKKSMMLMPVLVGMFLAAGAICLSNCDSPEDDEGSAVLCDFVCVYDESKQTSVCHWYCEDPEVDVACNNCDYFCSSGSCDWQCTNCDVGTY
jgi:hypothetical protein